MFLALIVFDFISFEGSKTHIKRSSKCVYIYIYIYIYFEYYYGVLTILMHLIKGSYYVLVWYFSLRASFNISFCPWTWLLSMPFPIMTSPRYYDVTHFSTDPNEICTVYICKIENKTFCSWEFFDFLDILLKKLRFINKNHLYCQVTLHKELGSATLKCSGRHRYMHQM